MLDLGIDINFPGSSGGWNGHSPSGLEIFTPDPLPVKAKVISSPLDFDVEKKRLAWNHGKTRDPRCDFADHRDSIVRKDSVIILCRWRTSKKGMLLPQIKADLDIPAEIAPKLAEFIRKLFPRIDNGDWAIITPPKRRHKTQNFASITASLIARDLGIPFYDDSCTCRTKQRINAVFFPNNIPPHSGLIIFDDIVTTGSTFQAMNRMLNDLPDRKTAIMISAINNHA